MHKFANILKVTFLEFTPTSVLNKVCWRRHLWLNFKLTWSSVTQMTLLLKIAYYGVSLTLIFFKILNGCKTRTNMNLFISFVTREYLVHLCRKTHTTSRIREFAANSAMCTHCLLRLRKFCMLLRRKNTALVIKLMRYCRRCTGGKSRSIYDTIVGSG